MDKQMKEITLEILASIIPDPKNSKSVHSCFPRHFITSPKDWHY